MQLIFQLALLFRIWASWVAQLPKRVILNSTSRSSKKSRYGAMCSGFGKSHNWLAGIAFNHNLASSYNGTRVIK